MPEPTPAVDRYRRRREAAAASREETRRRLLAAADELFRKQGYAETTVGAIATHADVSLQTLYLAWGSKRSLLLAAGSAAAVAAQLPVSHEDWRATIKAELATETADDPRASTYLGAVSRLFTRVAERTAPYWRMYRQAAAQDAEIAAFWDNLEVERRRTMDDVARSVHPRGLRPTVTQADIADTLWALASPDVYDLFTTRGARSPVAYCEWLEGTLVRALCDAEAQCSADIGAPTADRRGP